MKILSGALVYILFQDSHKHTEKICTPYYKLAFSYAYPKLLTSQQSFKIHGFCSQCHPKEIVIPINYISINCTFKDYCHSTIHGNAESK